MPGSAAHDITIDDLGLNGAQLTCTTCGWEQHVPSMAVADLLSNEHREAPETAEQGWAL